MLWFRSRAVWLSFIFILSGMTLMAFQNCSVPFNLLKTSSPAKASDISDMINSSEKEILETKAQLTESSSFAAESRAIATDVTTQSTQDKVRLRLKPKAIKKKKNGP